MTMHLSGYEPPRRNSGGLAIIREDVHIHLGAPDIRAVLADPTTYLPWLPEAIRDFQADSEGITFTLQLPGRSEAVALKRIPEADQRLITYRRDTAGSIETFAWALHPEGARECHVTAELAYRPASGFLGGSMETLLHRGQRIQVLRDLLWNMKNALEAAHGTSHATEDDEDDSASEAASA